MHWPYEIKNSNPFSFWGTLDQLSVNNYTSSNNHSIIWRTPVLTRANQSVQAVNTDGSAAQPRGWINASYTF